MNFVFLSPNFPEAYRWFCIRLRENGVNVLGVGDAPYDYLHPDLKRALTEYYRVDSLEDYDQVLRALGYYTGQYGKIDWVESNNEYWLELDAALRTEIRSDCALQVEACHEGILPQGRSALRPLRAGHNPGKRLVLCP